jgi:hypothetical protein
MNLTLDTNQRLNLIHMLDGLEAQGRREVHAVCKLQDSIDLTDEEKAAIQYRRERTPDGREYALWAANGHIGPRDYEFTNDDTQRLIRAIDNYRVVLARDRSWWMPLVAQLPEESNGNQ